MSKWSKRLDLSKKIFLITGAVSALAVAVIFQIGQYTKGVYTSLPEEKTHQTVSMTLEIKKDTATTSEEADPESTIEDAVEKPIPQETRPEEIPIVAVIEPEPIPQQIPDNQVLTTDRKTVENLIFNKTNDERMLAGLSPLELDPRLIEPAYVHSEDMALNVYFAHEGLDGCDALCRIKKVGYSFSVLGENLYYLGGYKLDEQELAARIVTGWMKSPHHRENILNPEFTHGAVGVYIVKDRLYATALYSRPR